MKILIRPSSIIERCLWHKYEYFILDGKTKEEIEKIITSDDEFEIHEDDALIIGLLNCIETDNLRHRLNQHLLHVMSIKNVSLTLDKTGKTTLLIKKNTILYEIELFKKNFPESWKPNANYNHSLSELKEYMKIVIDKIENLKIHVEEVQGFKNEYIQINHLKKILKFNS